MELNNIATSFRAVELRACRFLFAWTLTWFVVSDGFHLFALCRFLSFFVAGAVYRQLVELHQYLMEISLSSSPL
jgi:hypothetical protein